MIGKKTEPLDMSRSEYVVGLDLGTTKISVVVGERKHSKEPFKIIAVGEAPSKGIRKGLIVNLEQAVESVRRAVSDAQNITGEIIRHVTVSFGGGMISSQISKGNITLGREARPVTAIDIERVIDFAQSSVHIDPNQSIIHTIPMQYKLDNNEGIEDPLGMIGSRIDITLLTVMLPTTILQNLKRCLQSAGLIVDDFVLKPLTSALGALTPDEGKSGAVVVDMGGGTTSVAIFLDNRCKYLGLLPIGGDHITNDVASVLKIPLRKSEELKKSISLDPEVKYSVDDTIEFEDNSRKYVISKVDMQSIIWARIKELFSGLVRQQILNSGVRMLPAGMILTGGVAQTKGLEKRLSELLDMGVRVAVPLDASQMIATRDTEAYSSSAGIIRYIIEKERDAQRFISNNDFIDESAPQQPASVVMPARNMADNIRQASRVDNANMEDERNTAGNSLLASMFNSLKNALKEIF